MRLHPIGGTREDLRRHNLRSVLQCLHVSGPLSRADLTSRVGVNRSTIAVLLTELERLGAVVQEGPAEARAGAGAGRPSLMARPRPDLLQVIAVEVGVARVEVALVGLGGQILARASAQTPQQHPVQVADCVAELVQQMRGGAARILGIGVSIPGVVQPHDGVVRLGPNLGWRQIPFGDLLRERLPEERVALANDADLGALAEHLRGCAVGIDDLLFISGDVGVGAGVMVGGRTLAGAQGLAGEAGHMKVTSPGLPCHCGSSGCWETEVGADAVAAALGWEGLDSTQVLPRLRELPPAAPGALEEVATSLGRGLSSASNLLNPAQIVLSGLLLEVYRLCPEATVEALREGSLLTGQVPELRATALGRDAVLTGAAELAWGPFLADPGAWAQPVA